VRENDSSYARAHIENQVAYNQQFSGSTCSAFSECRPGVYPGLKWVKPSTLSTDPPRSEIWTRQVWPGQKNGGKGVAVDNYEKTKKLGKKNGCGRQKEPELRSGVIYFC